ncbi:MAG TPA: S1 family peptidase [Solirubrobacteraceae bacterium]|jgi:streptogrisin C|nr:S1 family peptidase [Solirubrobacteraceae bacterium]
MRKLLLAPGLIYFLLMPITAAVAEPSTEPMVSYLMAHYNISQTAATERIELQGRADDIVGQMAHALGPAFGGVWFDNATGRYNVGVVANAPHSSALPYLESHDIVDQTDFVSVRSSVADLESGKERIDSELSRWLSEGTVSTGMDTETNSIVVHIASNLSNDQVAAIKSDAQSEPVEEKVVFEPTEDTRAYFTACQNHAFGTDPQVLFCDRSLRGGVTIFNHFSGGHTICSLGFIVHNSQGEYIMTAGHCLTEGDTNWLSAFSDFSEGNESTWAFIGDETGSYMGENGDYGWIKVVPSGSPWFPINAPSSVASLDPYGPWGENQEQFLENITWSARGDINCHTGGSTDTQCGEVLETDETVNIEGKLIGKLTRDTFCSAKGDSGGTVWGNHSGMGMDEAINAPCGYGGAQSWYTEAIRDAYFMGLSFYVPPYNETY